MNPRITGAGKLFDSLGNPMAKRLQNSEPSLYLRWLPQRIRPAHGVQCRVPVTTKHTRCSALATPPGGALATPPAHVSSRAGVKWCK